jgi:hypothetical protein
MVNIDQVKIKKKLGAGIYGTTYLATYNDKEYALKIQHILHTDSKKDYNNEMWREISLYNYINKMNKKNQIFFTKMYDYKIYNNCTHIQDTKIDKDHPAYKKIMKLNNSPWCLKYLIEYKGKTTLNDFLESNKMTSKIALSFCLQIAKIILLLDKGGYSHNDLHPGNIMVNKTTMKYFSFNGKKIPTYGYLLSAIDYGEVLNKKFGIKYKGYNNLFLKDRKKWLFYEYFLSIFFILKNEALLIKDCNNQKKKLPWEYKEDTWDGMVKKIIIKHNDFFNKMKEKYLPLFPTCDKLLDYVIKTIKTKTILENIIGKKGEHDFLPFIRRIIFEFRIAYPDKFKKYLKWCSIRPFLLSNDNIKDLMLTNNFDDLINKIYSLL